MSPGPWSLMGVHCTYLVFVTRCPEGISEDRPCTPWSDTQCANQKDFQPSGTVDNHPGQPSSPSNSSISSTTIAVIVVVPVIVLLVTSCVVIFCLKFRSRGENVHNRHVLTGVDGKEV